MNEELTRNVPVWKSYVYHRGKCFFVSTIERGYDTYSGVTRGQETMTWECDPETLERGNMIHQAGHICDHQAVCRCLINFGEIPDEEDERWTRFRK
jgi:hypothetical protein